MIKKFMLTKRINTVAILIVALVISACSSSKLAMPIAENETGIKRTGEFVWIDLVTSDTETNTKFLTSLFGWEIKGDKAYSVAYSGTKPVAGIVDEKELSKDAISSFWVLSASVKDVDATLTKVKANGGKVISEKTTVPGRGETAIVQDKQEAYFSIMNNPNGDIKASAARNGEWLWAELWTLNPKEAASFYTNVLNCTSYPIENREDGYIVLKSEKYDFAGIVETPMKKEQPIWIPVLKVENPKDIASKALELGGKIILGPMIVSGKQVALIATPDGAPFLIQQWDN